MIGLWLTSDVVWSYLIMQHESHHKHDETRSLTYTGDVFRPYLVVQCIPEVRWVITDVHTWVRGEPANEKKGDKCIKRMTLYGLCHSNFQLNTQYLYSEQCHDIYLINTTCFYKIVLISSIKEGYIAMINSTDKISTRVSCGHFYRVFSSRCYRIMT